MRKRRLLAIFLVLVFAAASMSQTVFAASKAPKKIRLNKTKATMYVGETKTLKVTVTPKSASKAVKWTSSNKKVATVTKKGKIKALKAGKTVITCTSKSNKKVKAKCTITVKKPVKTNKIKFTNTDSDGNILLDVGADYKLKIKITPSNATYKTVKWKSSDKSVATVDENGNVTGVATGTAVVTCYSSKYPKVKAKCKVTVKEPVDDEAVLDNALSIFSLTGKPLYYWLHNDRRTIEETSSGQPIWSVKTNENGSLKYVYAYSSWDKLASTYVETNTPQITFDGDTEPGNPSAIRESLKNGSYNFAKDPQKVVVGWNMWASDETKASLQKMLNCKISDEVYQDLIDYRNTWAANYPGGGVMIIYGKNDKGVLTGRYAGYYTYNMSENYFTYAVVGVAPDDKETYGKVFYGDEYY